MYIAIIAFAFIISFYIMLIVVVGPNLTFDL
jgi:hypothetical protein